MPIRFIPFVSGQYYHIFNRGVEKRTTFIDRTDYQRAMNTFTYYQFSGVPLKLSRFLKLPENEKEKIMFNLQKTNQKLVEILCFTFMPNHFHFLIRQNIDGGVSKFVKKFSDSYTRYFNIIHERIGPLFQGQFKAVLVVSDEQLLHVSRYIHLNPISHSLVSDLDQLALHPWSSFKEYVNKRNNLCNTDIILDYFSHNEQKYCQFIRDQIDYQRTLESIKHLVYD